MKHTTKRITLILLTALMAFGFLVGGARITAFAREAESFDRHSSGDMASQPGEVEVFGTVEDLGLTSVTIDGREYQLLASTEFKGQIQVGDMVKLHVFPTADGFAVREIELSLGDDNANDNGDDDNDNDGDDDDDANDNGDDDNDNDGDDDDDANDNGDDDNDNDGDDDDNGNDHDDDDDANDNSDDDNGNDNGDDDSGNDNGNHNGDDD